MKISIIVTVLNEEKTIDKLLFALNDQLISPLEVVIVDGGSNDKTVEKINLFKKKHARFNLVLFKKRGNRSMGRNHAIFHAKSDWIAITDAGCVPRKNWLKELINTQQKTGTLVVAGYYSGLYNKEFQKAVIPYVLVMPDKIDKKAFLPATRSMMIKKEVWKTVGGFHEKLSDNEDYAFAKKISKNNFKISFAEKAVVDWMPPENLFSFSKMIFRFARGDIFSGIIRPKVALIFGRYFFLFLLIIFFKKYIFALFILLLFLLSIYSFWSVQKNYRYVKSYQSAWKWLPVLQISSDLAVIAGSISGFLNRYF